MNPLAPGGPRTWGDVEISWHEIGGGQPCGWRSRNYERLAGRGEGARRHSFITYVDAGAKLSRDCERC